MGTATNWKEANLFYLHAVAVKTDGTLWAWGQNSDGELGDGTIITRTAPTQIGTATNWLTANSGFHFSLGIKTNGTLWAWGDNSFGKLGDGTLINKLSPIQIGTATNWKSIDLGYSHSIATKTNANNLSTWGWNGYGQLADNSTNDSSIPLTIACPTTLTLSNDSFKNYAFSIYPNPASTEITIYSNLDLKIKNIKMIDLLGKVVIYKQNDCNFINIQDLSNGLFFIEIETEDSKSIFKFIKN